jgi:hypothetical protein
MKKAKRSWRERLSDDKGLPKVVKAGEGQNPPG